MGAVNRAVSRTVLPASDYAEQLASARARMQALDNQMGGSKAKRQIGEKTIPSMGDRMFSLYIGLSNSTYGPTDTHKDMAQWVRDDLDRFSLELESIDEDLTEVAKAIYKAGGPHIEGF